MSSSAAVQSSYLVGRVVNSGDMRFFFIETDGDQHLHARLSAGRKLGPKGEFTDSSELDRPKVGDLVCYEVEQTPRGPTANPWAFLRRGGD